VQKCIVLVTSSSFSAEQKNNIHSLNALFDAKKIKREEIDGALEENVEKRNQLFGISGVRGTYPQVFLEEDDEITFVGLFDQIHVSY